MSLIISLIESAQGHYPLVLLMVFLLTFTKSCALVSLAIPAPPVCCCWGHSLPPASSHFLLMWSSASLGAIGGFWLSWWLGVRYYHRLTRVTLAHRRGGWPAADSFSAPRAVGGLLPVASSLPARHPAPGPAAPAACRCGRFSWLTSAPVCCGRFCCSPRRFKPRFVVKKLCLSKGFRKSAICSRISTST